MNESIVIVGVNKWKTQGNTKVLKNYSKLPKFKINSSEEFKEEVP